MSTKVVITKAGSEVPPPPPLAPPPPPMPPARPGARRRVTGRTKTYPAGILKKTAKIKPVRDPAKAPPFRKGIRKHTVRVLTEKGIESRRRTIRHKVGRMSEPQLRERLQKAGISHNPKTPPNVLRAMVEGGAEAGMISI